MSIEETLTADQFRSLLNAPAAAATYVATASGGGFDVFKEIMTASKFTANLAGQASGSGYGELVDELLASMKGMSAQDAKANAIQYQSKDPSGMRAEAKQMVADGLAVAAGLPGGEGFRRWILEMARQVAETKTGGFLGVGGKAVIDEQEQAALNEIAALLA